MRLPPRIGKTAQPASLVCPECGGALSAQAEGDAEYLLFVCQVGHSYSTATLLFGKEQRLEEVLWSAVYLLEELADLLADLVHRGGPDGVQPEWPPARRRIARLHDQAKRLRQLLDDNEPIDLGNGAVSGQDTP
jgi:two-component system, chemotaxis family, protein-glutamate methylesterase/glutaminase